MRPLSGVASVLVVVIGLTAVGLPTRSTTAAVQLPATADSLRRLSPMSESRAGHTATTLPDGNVLLVGGFTVNESRLAGSELFEARSERFESIGQPEVFDPSRGEFGIARLLLTGRYKHQGTSFVLDDGRMLVSGGAPSVELCDPAGRGSRMVGRDSRLSGHFSVTARLPGGGALVTGGYRMGGDAASTGVWAIDISRPTLDAERR